jgi:hypothetical protein
MSTVNNGFQIVKSGLVLDLDAGNKKSYSTNRFQALGSGTITENVTFPIQGNGTFQRVAFGTVVGGYTIKPTDVVYSYALGVNGCHYHGNVAPIPAGAYLTFSCDYLVTGATTYPINNTLLVVENYGGGALSASIGGPNSLQNIWQRVTFTVGPTSSAGSQAMFLYPGYCGPGRLADSGTLYFRNPKVEWTNTDTGNSTFSSTSNIGLWYDLSGNGYNGTLNGPTSNVSNKGNLLFNGTSDYVIVPSGGSYSEYTFMFFCKWITDTANGSRLFGCDGFGTYTIFTPSNVGFHYNQIAGSTTTLSSGVNVGLGTWCHVAVTVSTLSSLARIYINGILKNTTSTIPYVNLSGNLFLGAQYSSTLFANCNIAAFQLYNRVLSATEITQNYEATKTRFGL